MERKYSKYSVILIVVGIFIAYMIFPPVNITFGKWSMVAIPIGFAIYLTGVILSGDNDPFSGDNHFIG
ncbi:hypothetical protein NSQ43_06640 [Sporosarcina sp. FSL W8-0480]|uniref:hypothetical protein n=1 Tax=Sporosarcina sp. FSL W8-0480 TaxID=2954701 RepID=UPI0030D6DC61